MFFHTFATGFTLLLLAFPFTSCSPTNIRMTLDVSIDPPNVFADVPIICEKQGFFGHPCNCTKFYRCVDFQQDGKAFTIFHFDCGEGTIFDESLSVCNHPWAVSPPPPCMAGCAGDPHSPKDTDLPETDQRTFKTIDRLAETGPQAFIGRQRKATKNYSTAFTCVADGSFPDPSDCNKYHECSLNDDSSWRHDVDFCGKTQQFCASLKACGPAAGCPEPCAASEVHLKDGELK